MTVSEMKKQEKKEHEQQGGEHMCPRVIAIKDASRAGLLFDAMMLS